MNNAKELMCPMLSHPKDDTYAEAIRRFQGCPTIAITRGGRIYAAWYAGGTREPHIENYNLLIYSDDSGKTWTDPIMVIPSNEAQLIHALDIQLWTSPQGKLYVFWVQNNVRKCDAETTDKPPYGTVIIDQYLFDDRVHAAWMSVCEEPDAPDPAFSPGRCWSSGFLRCKPLVMSNGEWLLFNYDQTNDRYGYTLTADQGRTFTRYYGSVKQNVYFDEAMAYEKKNGEIRLLARCKDGQIAQALSRDFGKTWSESSLSGITAPDSRHFVARTPSGRVLLVRNDHATKRSRMTICLSDDDGVTWKYQRCIDQRMDLSYPDADFYGGKIYLVYDRERCGAREILFACFTEADVMDDRRPIEIALLSKPATNAR